MPTFQEIGRQYADRVTRAMARDGFTKTASASVHTVRGSAVANELKAIAGELDTYWQVDSRLLTDEQKKLIAKEAGLALGLEHPDEFNLAVRCASNDAYMELVDHISNIIKKK